MPSIPLSAVIMEYSFIPVPLSSIDLSDKTYRISTARPLAGLIESTRETGLINPPILISKGQPCYRLVSGFHRAAACFELGWHEMTARVLPEDASPKSCLGLAIADNAQHRELNPIELARAVEKLAPFFDTAEAIARYGNQLGLSLNRELIDRLKRINRLPAAVKKMIAANTISLAIALELEKLPPEAAEALSALFHEIRPTLSHQKEMLTLAKDIARAEDNSISGVLANAALQEIRLNPDFTRQQKIRGILDWLQKRRYPRIQRFERRFARSLRTLDLPPALSLKAPPHFEGTQFSLVIQFHSPAELKSHLQTLQHIADTPNFVDMINKKIDDPELIH